MSLESQFEREIEILDRQYDDGDITGEEYNAERNNLEREFRQYAEAEAEEAYDRAMEGW